MVNQSKLILFAVFIAIIVGGFISVIYFTSKDNGKITESSEELEQVTEVRSEPAFAWYFTEADTNNLDGNPQTEVFLIANYDDSSIEKLVDTVDGSCSELEGEKYEGDVSNTGKVQCYYAGLGQRYRIVENEDSYLVERKFFEEALPNYLPPESEWEVIATFTK